MFKSFLILTLILNLSMTGLIAQIVHENTYMGAAEVADVENFGYKYFITDYINNAIAVYNEDHSLWKNIVLPVPLGTYLYDVDYVSSKVFNSDDMVEVLMVTYKYISTSDTSGYYVYDTYVANENGTVIVDVPGGAYSFTFTDNNNKNKLVIYVYDYSASTYITQTEVFNLPDKSSGIKEIFAIENGPFPNPALAEINLPLNNAGLTGNQQLMITDNSGRVFYQESISSINQLNLSTSTFPAGVYQYSVICNGRSIPAGKFVVRK
jgi:hypothetical protein